MGFVLHAVTAKAEALANDDVAVHPPQPLRQGDVHLDDALLDPEVRRRT